MGDALKAIVEARAEELAAKLGVPKEEAARLVLESLRTTTVKPDHGTGH